MGTWFARAESWASWCSEARFDAVTTSTLRCRPSLVSRSIGCDRGASFASVPAPRLVEHLADLPEHGGCDIVAPAGKVGLFAGHRRDDPRRAVGLEESRIDERSRAVAGLVEHAHRHLEPDIHRIRYVRQPPGEPDEVLLAEQHCAAPFIELRVDLRE